MPDDPVFLAAGKGSHCFHGRGCAVAGEALLAGGAQHLAICGWREEVCPGSPSSLMCCGGRFFSIEVVSSGCVSYYWDQVYGFRQILFCQIFLCMADASMISGQMSGFDYILIWAISKKFYRRCLFLSSDCQHFTQHSHRMGSACLLVMGRTRLGTIKCLIQGCMGPRVQKGIRALKDWNSNSVFPVI